ncbi:MAG: TonB-dependent receptor [Gemmatimonadota bacterium]|nr:TonB-dependent receptor [Gemmatimonadota bacterium]MDQ8178756.1 TonB-dependent receptor [Gemmatimonadota bacterium]
MRWRAVAPVAPVALVALTSILGAQGTAPVPPAGDSVRTRLETVVITAARREQRLKDVVVPTEVIGRSEILRTGATDVAALLQQFVGMQVDGSVGGGQGIQLQGMDARRVLVLIDGQPIIGRVNGDFDLSRLSLAGIERIEVVKGPQGTLYGSEALGGVVNIITRSTRGGRVVEGQGLGGTRGRADLSLGGRLPLGRLRLTGDASLRRSDLAVGIPGDLGTRTARWTVSPGAEWVLSDAVTLRATALGGGQSQRYRTGQLFRFVDDVQAGARLGGEWRRGASRITPLLYLSTFDHLARASTGGRPLAGTGERDRQSLTEFEVTGGTLVGSVLIDGGVEGRRERIRSDRIPDQERSLDAIEGFTQVTLARDPVTVVTGVRLVRHSQFGDFAAPRFSLLARPSDVLALRASVGRGFRAPDFKELFLAFANSTVGYAVSGNPSLRPERSTNSQLGLEWNGSQGWLRFTGFVNHFDDFIAFAPGEMAGTFTYRNIETGVTRGVEIEGALARARWRADLGYTYLEARDGLRRPLPSRPTHSGRAAVTMPLPRQGSLAVTWVITGRTPTAVGLSLDVTAIQPAFARLDLSATVPVIRGVGAVVGVENAVNRQLGPDWPGFTGRLLYAGLRWSH